MNLIDSLVKRAFSAISNANVNEWNIFELVLKDTFTSQWQKANKGRLFAAAYDEGTKVRQLCFPGAHLPRFNPHYHKGPLPRGYVREENEWYIHYSSPTFHYWQYNKKTGELSESE